MTCPKCGENLPADTRVCPRDGTSLQQQTIALSSSAIEILGPTPPSTPGASPPARVTVRARSVSEPDASGASTTDPLIGCVIDGRYSVKRQLGGGGMGSVYEAEQIELKKLVAIKVLHSAVASTEDFRKRFEREAQAASRLSHPGCVAVLDFSRISRVEPAAGGAALMGVAYLVMELVKGELLLDRLERGPLPPREAVAVVRSLLSALGHAHGLDLVHRDVKPANIMLSRSSDGELQTKLLDFGLAKSVAEDSTDAQQPLTAYGMVCGTPKYLSPEQASAKLLDRRSDLYSAGVVLFEATCGRPPFDRDDVAALVRDHLFTAPPSPREHAPTISSELDAVILKALMKDPDQRFQTAKEFLAALDACPEASIPVEIAMPSPLPRSVSLGDRLRPFVERVLRMRPHVERVLHHRHRKAFAAGLGGVLVLGGALLWMRARSTRPPVQAPVVAAPAAQVGPSSSVRRHLALAEEYQQKLWCGDALDEMERALNEDPSVRTDPELVRIAIPCLRTRTQPKALRFLVERVGASAQGELQAALGGDLKPDVKQGVERALARLAGH